jgi:hypothetical protein
VSHLRRYTDFDLWFEAVADIDPLALEAPHRVTLDKPGLACGGFQIATVLT